MPTPMRLGCGGAAHSASPEAASLDQSGSTAGAVSCCVSPVLLPQHRRPLAVPADGEPDRRTRTGGHAVHLEVRSEPAMRDAERQQAAAVGDAPLDLGDEPPDRRRHAADRRTTTACRSPSCDDPTVADASLGGSRRCRRRPDRRRPTTASRSHARSARSTSAIVRPSDRSDRLDDLGHPGVGVVAEATELGHVEQEADRVVVDIDRTGEQQVAASRGDRFAETGVGQHESAGPVHDRLPTTHDRHRRRQRRQRPRREPGRVVRDRHPDRRPVRHRQHDRALGQVDPADRDIGRRTFGEHPRSRRTQRRTAAPTRSRPRSPSGRRRRAPTTPAGSRRPRAPAAAVSTTGVPSMRRWRTAASDAGTCQRSSAATNHCRVDISPSARTGTTSPHGDTQARARGADDTDQREVGGRRRRAPSSVALTRRIRPCGCAASARRAHPRRGGARDRRRRSAR